MIVQLPFYFFLSHEKALNVPRRWTHSTHWLHRIIVGTRYEITGLENVPEEGCIVAAKHQSLWDFYSLYTVLRDPSFVLKSELMKIPLFGWYVGHLDMIPINRGERSRAMRQMIREAQRVIANGRQILIFPEGTRKAPGDDPDYRYGVAKMYLQLNCKVVPVALNSGIYWPRRSFIRHPGTIRAHFLPAIEPGLTADEFLAELEQRIENACIDLYSKAVHDPVPISDSVRAKIDG